MSTNFTSHLGLSQWLAEDAVLREDFNRDNAAIDAACAAIPGLATGSYTGSGTYGPEEEATALTFDFVPRLVVVVPDSDLSLYGVLVLVQGQSAFNGSGFLSSSNAGLALAVGWNGKAVSWYCTTGGSGGKQFNEEGVTYRYFAVG